jgi:hypothetical protein
MGLNQAAISIFVKRGRGERKFLIENYMFSDTLDPAGPIFSKAFDRHSGITIMFVMEAIQ